MFSPLTTFFSGYTGSYDPKTCQEVLHFISYKYDFICGVFRDIWSVPLKKPRKNTFVEVEVRYSGRLFCYMVKYHVNVIIPSTTKYFSWRV